jgi:hypothetical protein
MRTKAETSFRFIYVVKMVGIGQCKDPGMNREQSPG